VQGVGKYAKDNHKVLVLGGSGGVGSFAVQYCKAKGCFVAATCGERNVELLNHLGVDKVINYQVENWWESLQGEDYDVIFDCVGGEHNWVFAERVLKLKGGNYITIAGDDNNFNLQVGNLVGIVASVIQRKVMSFLNHPNYYFVTVDCTKANDQLIEVRGLIEGGFIRPVIRHEADAFNLGNIAQAFAQSIGGHTTGKIGVVVGKNANLKEFDENYNY